MTIRSLYVFLLLALISCGDKPVYQDKQTIVESWSYDQPIGFTLPATDTSTMHELFVDISHTTDYPFQNLYVKMETIFPSGKKDRRTINIDLADKAGNWFGSCSSSKCQFSSLLRDPFSFSETGTYDIKLYQHTRTKELQGIEKIGISLY